MYIKNFSFITKIISVVILAIFLFFISLMTRGSEDVWICAAGKWVKHGNPTAPMPPASECGS